MSHKASSYSTAADGPAPASLVGWFCWLLASGLGAGRSPIAPGTVGTLWGLPVAWGVQQLPSAWAAAAAVLVLVLLGVPVCTRAAREAGGAKDPGFIVWDEIASMPLVFWGIGLSPAVALAGFLLHRLFDIWKPPPARQLESLPAGWGIMADDLAAAVYARVALGALIWAGVV